MHLSEVLLNPALAEGRRDLSSVYELHRTLCAGFPTDARPRLLFRQDKPAHRILLLSERPPDYEAQLRTGHLLSARSKPFEPQVLSETELRFKLRANPTRKERGGTRRALNNGADQMEWLRRKGEQHGFSLVSAHVVEQRYLLTGRGDNPAMQHLAVDYHGRLTLQDSTLFLHTLSHGIGPAKAFGFGLLCVAR